MNKITSYGAIDLADENQERALRQIDNECAECRLEVEKKANRRILAAVIENELTDNEKCAVKLHWFRGMKCPDIAHMSGTSVQNVRSTVKRAEKKIYSAMKYVVLYDRFVSGNEKIPEDFHFKIINCLNGKELIS